MTSTFGSVLLVLGVLLGIGALVLAEMRSRANRASREREVNEKAGAVRRLLATLSYDPHDAGALEELERTVGLGQWLPRLSRERHFALWSNSLDFTFQHIDSKAGQQVLEVLIRPLCHSPLFDPVALLRRVRSTLDARPSNLEVHAAIRNLIESLPRDRVTPDLIGWLYRETPKDGVGEQYTSIPELDAWRARIGGEVYSATIADLHQWIRESRLSPSDRVQKGYLPWAQVSLVPQLRGITVDPVLASRSEIPEVPDGIKTCPACAETIQAQAVKCRHCGSSVLSPGWAHFTSRYSSADASNRSRLWAAMREPQREYLETLLSQAPNPAASTPVPPGALSCPQCAGPAYGGRGGCLILLIILTFPIGLLLLLIRPTYTCIRCGFRFAG